MAKNIWNECVPGIFLKAFLIVNIIKNIIKKFDPINAFRSKSQIIEGVQKFVKAFKGLLKVNKHK